MNSLNSEAGALMDVVQPGAAGAGLGESFAFWGRAHGRFRAAVTVFCIMTGFMQNVKLDSAVSTTSYMRKVRKGSESFKWRLRSSVDRFLTKMALTLFSPPRVMQGDLAALASTTAPTCVRSSFG